MKRIKNTLRYIGEMAEVYAKQEQQVKELTYKLMSKTHGLEADQAEKVARVLVSQAELTWK